MAYYLSDSELFYEIVLSKGKGKLTRKAENYLSLIATNLIKRFSNRFKDFDEEQDCKQYGLLVMLENWYGFDDKKYKTALPYYTEITKRAITYQFNELRGRRSHQKNYVKFISLDTSNDGKGLHNF
jgi:hypothetical protein